MPRRPPPSKMTYGRSRVLLRAAFLLSQKNKKPRTYSARTTTAAARTCGDWSLSAVMATARQWSAVETPNVKFSGGRRPSAATQGWAGRTRPSGGRRHPWPSVRRWSERLQSWMRRADIGDDSVAPSVDDAECSPTAGGRAARAELGARCLNGERLVRNLRAGGRGRDNVRGAPVEKHYRLAGRPRTDGPARRSDGTADGQRASPKRAWVRAAR